MESQRNKGVTRRDFFRVFGKSVVFCSFACSCLPLLGKQAGLFSSGNGAVVISGTDNDPAIEGIQVNPKQYVTWIIEYTAGSTGIEAGGMVYFRFISFHESRISIPQCTNPVNPGYTTVSTDGSCSLSLFADYAGIYVTVENQPLLEGEKVTVMLGDTQQGSAGFRVPVNSGGPITDPLREDWHFHPRIFRTSIKIDSASDYVELDEPDIFFTVVHGELHYINAIIPSKVVSGDPIRTVINITDEYGNVIKDFAGTVSLSCTDPSASFPSQLVLTPDDNGHKTIDSIVFNTLGTHVLHASIDGHAIESDSNQIECMSSSAKLILWGDIHCHSQLSDGRETPDHSFDYAQNISNLDFHATTEHTRHPSQAQWIEERVIPKVAEYNQPGIFSTILAYEWSKSRTLSPHFGHRNVYFRGAEADFLATDYSDYGTTELLFAALEGLQAIVIPHHSSWVNCPIDWNNHHAKLQRLVEIYSVHGMNEYQGNPRPVITQLDGHNVQDGLSLGCKLGIICSSDSHLTRPGMQTKYDFKPYRCGIAAVYAEENTREAIWDALYSRHCYGTTGERISLDFTINGKVMGSEIAPPPGSNSEINVKVLGTTILDSVEIIKAHIGDPSPFPTVHEVNPGLKDFEFTWIDPVPVSDCFYYIRVTQADGEMAWSSPIWVSPSMRIQGMVRDAVSGDVTIHWGCLPYRLYSVYYKDDIDADWQLAQADIPSDESGTIEWTDDGSLTGEHPSSAATRYYSVRVD